MAPEGAVLSAAAHAADAPHIMQHLHDIVSELFQSCTCVNWDQLSIQEVLLSLVGVSGMPDVTLTLTLVL